MPTIDDVVNGFAQDLLRQERAAASQMVRVYGEAWSRIKKQIASLNTEYEQARKAKQSVGLDWYYRSRRALELQTQIVSELNKFTQYAKGQVTANQAKIIAQTRQQAEDLMRLRLGPEPPGVYVGFNALPVKTIETMVGMNQSGSPLTRLLIKASAKGAQEAQDALIQGIALGKNPRAIASEIRDALGKTLNQALTIARTEMLRAQRITSQETYRANPDVVKGWIWSAALDERTCASCYVMHGTEHPNSEKFASHPSCRCTCVPQTYTYAELGARYGIDLSAADKAWPTFEELAKKYNMSAKQIEMITRRQMTGEDAFKSLSDTEQRNILGPSKYAAWKDGKFEFSALSVKTYSADWGDGRRVPTLDELGITKEKLE